MLNVTPVHALRSYSKIASKMQWPLAMGQWLQCLSFAGILSYSIEYLAPFIDCQTFTWVPFLTSSETWVEMILSVSERLFYFVDRSYYPETAYENIVAFAKHRNNHSNIYLQIKVCQLETLMNEFEAIFIEYFQLDYPGIAKWFSNLGHFWLSDIPQKCQYPRFFSWKILLKCGVADWVLDGRIQSCMLF